MEITQQLDNRGNTSLIVIGVISALVIVLSIPILAEIGDNTETSLGTLVTEMGGDDEITIN